MKVRYTLRAQSDLDAIFNYLGQHDRAAAEVVQDQIKARVDRLADFPLMAPMTDEPGVRELSIVRFPYTVYYQVTMNEVWILHVRDERRTPWKG